MDALFQAALHTHELVALLLIVAQLAFLRIESKEPFIPFVYAFRKLFLVQNILLAILVFTGLLMLAVLHFAHWNLPLILMIAVAFMIFVNQIRLNRRLRVIRSDEVELQREFKAFARRLYLKEALILAILFIVAKVL
ncbi:MAG: hypothetical protein C6I00_06125 [Nitratiruptor sp.]|nr:hypothetical protein [Nitratiruptor sp.]NPA83020.1 hypothetical protein [Campylobacterota bacterium]